MATLVFLKKNGKWLITAGENVRVNEIAKPHDPVLQMQRISNLFLKFVGTVNRQL